MKETDLKVGDKIKTWFSGREDEMSTVLKILPYTGIYDYDCVLVLTNRTGGETKMAHKNKE